MSWRSHRLCGTPPPRFLKSWNEWLAHPKDANLDFTLKDKYDRWSWCGALFMAPPVWLRLWQAIGDRRLLDLAIEKWWETSGYLYERSRHLYFRDGTCFGQREANGQKIF